LAVADGALGGDASWRRVLEGRRRGLCWAVWMGDGGFTHWFISEFQWGEDWQGCCSVGQRWLRLRIEEEVREDDGLCMEDWFVWVQGLIWFYGEMVVDLEPQNWNLIFSKLKCQILSIVTWRHIISCYFHNLPGLQHPQFPSKTNKKSPHKNPNNQSLEKNPQITSHRYPHILIFRTCWESTE
jgi:hypothetical protein